MVNINNNELKRIGIFISKKLGFIFDEKKLNILKIKIDKVIKSLKIEENNIISLLKNHTFIKKLEEEILINVTEFFRQKKQFFILANEFLPYYIKKNKDIRINILSAGCSSGEEVYSILITLKEVLKKYEINKYKIKIVGIDYSEKVLEKARRGIYYLYKLKGLNQELLKKYFLRGIGRMDGFVKIKDEFKKYVEFRVVNLKENFKLNEKFDIIFFRNVLIYFDEETQRSILMKMYNFLKKDGLLFIGYSENIMNLNLPFKYYKLSIYKK